MAAEKKTSEVKALKRKHIFMFIYIAELLCAAIIGLLRGSFFAYKAFNSAWAFVIYIACIVLMYLTAFVQGVTEKRNTADVVWDAVYFIGGALLCALTVTAGGVFAVCAVVYSAFTASHWFVSAALKLRRGDENYDGKVKRLVAAVMLLIFPLGRNLGVSYVNELQMLWVIPGAVITVAAIVTAAVLLRGVWGRLYTKTWQKITYTAVGILGAVMFAFSYSYSFIGAVNCELPCGQPERVESVVLDKRASSGAHSVARFEFKINVGGKSEWVGVSPDDYYTTEAGETVIINYYKGALRISYYEYGGKPAVKIASAACICV